MTADPRTTDGGGAFSIFQDGMKVAGGFGTWEAVLRDAQHYAAVYGQDGPVKVTIRRIKPRKTKT